MIKEAQRVRPNVKPHTPQEILSVYLNREYEEMQAWIHGLKPNWKQYGMTTMCDGWTRPTKLSIINFMAYCRGQPVFLKSINASTKIKDHKYIYDLLKGVIRDVGSQTVVQVVTDNGSAFIKARKKLIRKYNLYWTPCAACCIDLMLEGIGQRDSNRRTIQDARRVTNFIYNDSWLLVAMREYCEGDIVSPGATRFATNFIALDYLYRHCMGLINLFRSERYFEWNQRKTEGAKNVSKMVFSDSFWDRVHNVVSILHPIYKVLQAVDNKMWLSMGSMYEFMRIMIEGIMTIIPSSYQWVINIIDHQWTKTRASTPPTYYLNSEFHYKRRLYENNDLMMAVYEVFERLFPESTAQTDFVSDDDNETQPPLDTGPGDDDDDDDDNGDEGGNGDIDTSIGGTSGVGVAVVGGIRRLKANDPLASSLRSIALTMPLRMRTMDLFHHPG
ncbi:uncharacterized protein LOC131236340 [Magnolia sinica]|uniref:uncharacterized protein LOC131236340 n=1 Tax=Magnolia sinica TaxID=86752 RepID=UPI00265AC3BA|nr:uncharacterized protein LOC131236340 [Magnolia sinica]